MKQAIEDVKFRTNTYKVGCSFAAIRYMCSITMASYIDSWLEDRYKFYMDMHLCYMIKTPVFSFNKRFMCGV